MGSGYIAEYSLLFDTLGSASPAPSVDFQAFCAMLQVADREFSPESVYRSAEEASVKLLPSLESAWSPTEAASVLHEKGNLRDTIAEFQSRRTSDGFTPERAAHFADDPQYDLIRSIAGDGIIIQAPPNFRNLTIKETFRPVVTRLPSTMRCHALKSTVAGRSILLERSSIPDPEFENLSFCSIHLAPKPPSELPPGVAGDALLLEAAAAKAALGRFCVDPSNTEDGVVPLNSPEGKLLAIDKYGKVTHPTIDSVVSDWDEYRQDKKLQWRDMWLAKEDVDSAFPQLKLAPESALMMAVAISATLILINLYGTFGWTGLPMAFAVVGAAILRAILPRALAVHHAYCDDFFWAGSFDHVSHDQPIVQRTLENTFGSPGRTPEKSVGPTQCTDILGWVVDFQNDRVLLKQRAIRKLAYAFFSFKTTDSLPISDWQRLASLASRYSRASAGLSPYVAPLFAMTRRSGGRLKACPPNANAKVAIEMWRMAILRMHADPFAFAMSVERFGRLPPQPGAAAGFHYGISDASTPQLAAALYQYKNGPLLAWTTYVLPFEYLDSRHATRFQNEREFLGLLLLLVLTAHTLPASASIPEGGSRPLIWSTDSRTAESWAARDGTSASRAAQATAISIAWLQIAAAINLVAIDWRSSEEMGDIDRASRNRPAPSLLPELFVNLQSSIDASRMFHDCDFTKTLDCAPARSLLFDLASRMSTILARP